MRNFWLYNCGRHWTLWLLPVTFSCLACQRPELRGSAAPLAKQDAPHELYGYVLMTPAARRYGFHQDTLPELRPSEVPSKLREAAAQHAAATTNADPDAQACTRFFGRNPPYLVLFVFECPTTGMITDNTVVELFLPDSTGGFTVRDDAGAWGDIEPVWRNKEGKGGGVGLPGVHLPVDTLHVRVRKRP